MKATIITICRNAEELIERTIQSALAEKSDDVEYIVIDGASTDGTRAVIEKYLNSITKFISEPDSGISDAWNKGIALATGEVIGLLNAGDTYEPGAIERAMAAHASGIELSYGDTRLVDEHGKTLVHNRGRFHLWWYSAGFGFYHPSCFVNKSLYDRIGTFNCKLKYAMDSDLFARAAFSGARIGYSGVQATMIDGGISVVKRFSACGEYWQSLREAGASETLVYKSMLMTALRGLVRNALRGPRQ